MSGLCEDLQSATQACALQPAENTMSYSDRSVLASMVFRPPACTGRPSSIRVQASGGPDRNPGLSLDTWAMCDVKQPLVVVSQVAAISSLTPALRTVPGLLQQVGEVTCLRISPRVQLLLKWLLRKMRRPRKINSDKGLEREGLVAKSTGCSRKGPEFRSQHPHGGANNLKRQ